MVYAVNTAEGTCDCPDVANGAPERNGVRYCKHLLSTIMLTRLTTAAVKRRARRDFDRLVPTAAGSAPSCSAWTRAGQP